MAKTETLANIRTRVRERVDLEDMDTTNGFIDDSELNGFINASYGWLYDKLVHAGVGQYESTNDFIGTGAATYALPSDHYAPLSVFYVDTDRLVPLKEIQVNEIHQYTTTAQSRAEAYRIYGTVIAFYPPPSSGTYRMYYAPAFTSLSSDGDTVDGVNGWEEFIVVDAAIKCLHKDETNADHLIRERGEIVDRIDAMAQNKKAGPFRVVDIEDRRLGYGGMYDPASWYWRIY